MSRSRVVLAICILAATAVLASLGVWQVQRLAWKQDLIATVEARRLSDPQPLEELVRRWQETGDVDYWPVTATGKFDHAREQFFYTTWKGAVGWNVLAPFEMDDGGWLIVNRGFVPDQLRDPASRADGQVEGSLEIAGLARNPLFEKPNQFVPDNNLDAREFYWKSYPQLVAQMGLGEDTVPFLVDLDRPQAPGGHPQAGTTLIAFSNSHLQYAITWFGLAAACLGVGGWFLFGSRQPVEQPTKP